MDMTWVGDQTVESNLATEPQVLDEEVEVPRGDRERTCRIPSGRYGKFLCRSRPGPELNRD